MLLRFKVLLVLETLDLEMLELECAFEMLLQQTSLVSIQLTKAVQRAKSSDGMKRNLTNRH